MNEISDLTARLCQAIDLPSTLADAYDAFDVIRLAIRGREEPDSGMFAALVMSAAAAIDGRDAVARAPSLPLSCPRLDDAAPCAVDAPPEIQSLTGELARLASALAWQLNLTGQAADLAGDRDACAQAAACAREIHGLLAGALG